MENKFSYFRIAKNLKKKYGIYMGSIGGAIVVVSIAIELLFSPSGVIHFIISLLKSLGEIIFITGFFVILIEHTTVEKFITKEISVSIIKDLFRFYFTKEQMKDLIGQLSEDIYQYENIPEEVMELYKSHAIPELFNEPIREYLRIKLLYLGDLENNPDVFLSLRSWSFRVLNTAKSDDIEKYSKQININGLIHKFSRPIYEIEFPFDGSAGQIQEHLERWLDVEFSYILFSASRSTKKEVCSPIFIPVENFDHVEGIPIGAKYASNNEFYVVYERKIDESGMKKIEICYYFKMPIPPGESLGIELNYKTVSKNFDILILEFPSYTRGFNFEIDFGEKFLTSISSILNGNGYISDKSNKKLLYSGWIIPHSAISCSWNKMN